MSNQPIDAGGGTIRSTAGLKHMIIPRLVAGLPLAGFGTLHLLGAAPMRPILEAGGIPFVGFNAVFAPAVEVLAGVMLLLGAFARVGGALGAGVMVVALYTHIVANWQDEPPMVIPALVLASCLYVAWRGGGAWSLDRAWTVRGKGEPPGRPKAERPPPVGESEARVR